MLNLICFHNPDEENGYLSNWYPSVFSYDGTEYSSMEQYMMHQKALCFSDKEIADAIMETDDVAEIKKLGRLVSNYNDHVWNGKRQIIVFEGLFEKFSQKGDYSSGCQRIRNQQRCHCFANRTGYLIKQNK